VRTDAFDDLPATPATHARLYFYAAVIGLVRQALESFGSFEALAKRFPFVGGYVNELATFGLEGVDIARAPARWRDAVQAWERRESVRLPLRALAGQTGLGYAELVALVGATLVDEEMRFGALFCALHGVESQPRPSAGMVARWAECEAPDTDLAPVRRLIDLGLLEATNPDAPAAAWCVRLPAAYANVLLGGAPALGPGIRYRAAAQLPRLDSLLLPDRLRETAERLRELIAQAEVDTVVVRGPRGNARRTLVQALAGAQGQGVLEVQCALNPAAALLKALGPLCALLDAVPLFVFECAPGDSAALPEVNGEVRWRAAVLGAAGGIRGLGGRKPAVLTLPLPDVETRRRLWARATPQLPERDAGLFAQRYRMTSGAILQMATAANAQARLSGAAAFGARHLAQARETLDRGELETLATRIAPARGWDQLVTAADTRAELAVLEQRCRHRERLSAGAGAASCGVRALLKGPSGCGKTLAARVLACALDHMDLYRVDLAAVVDKYVGESEKRLGRLFDRAQELDAILLFDEGDALFGRRTASLHSSTDRYANLQTNFLLQRLETHDGIVLVTTNLADAIDSAFQRRMDVVVEFGQPDAEQRLAIWRLHLPAEHQVRGELLEEVAYRCSLSGGQIRNAASHAELVALSQETALRGAHLLAAVQREYRKSGALCPLRAHERAA
jgi:MoxR-like ATPase